MDWNKRLIDRTSKIRDVEDQDKHVKFKILVFKEKDFAIF